MKKNILAKVSVIALLVGIGFTFVYCSKDGNWENYKRKNEIYDFSVLRFYSVFPVKAIGEATTIRIKLNTVYPFKKIPMNAKVIYNSGKGRLKTKLGRIFEPNIDYILNDPENVFEYIGEDKGTHKFTIVFFNDKGVRKEEVITINYATMDFNIEFKPITTGNVYQGDNFEYILKVIESKAPQDNHYVIFSQFDGEIVLNSETVQLNKPYSLSMGGDNFVKLTSIKSGRVKLIYKAKNSTTETSNREVILDFKQRKIRTEDFKISSNTISKNTNNHRIFGRVIKTTTPEAKTSTNNIRYRVWLASVPYGYKSGINIEKNGEYKEDVLTNSGEWETKFNVGDAPVGKYKIGVQFKDEYGNESKAEFFEINVLSGEPSWVIESTR